MSTYGCEPQPLIVTPKHRSIPITFWLVGFSLIIKELRGVPKGTLIFNCLPLFKDHPSIHTYMYACIVFYAHIHLKNDVFVCRKDIVHRDCGAEVATTPVAGAGGGPRQDLLPR